MSASHDQPVLQPVSVPKPAAMLAEVLRDKILRGEFPEGEALPPERTLVEQSRLSRAAVREALGILKQQGLVTTRPGRHGGTLVTRPSADDLRGSLEVYMQSHGWDTQTPVLVELREIVEPWCAALAAARHTADDLATLQERLATMVRSVHAADAHVAASLEWHAAVADASRNVLLSALMRARRADLLTAADHARYADEAARRASVETHTQVTRAIEARDPRAAFELMERHVRSHARPLLDALEDET